MKHFKLRKDLCINHFGRTLYRIECIREFGKKDVKAGDLGGFVEKEDNLSGDAWVFGNARVFGNAKVFGNAAVFEDAWVSENAQVCRDAKVYGDAAVFEDAKVCGDVLIYGNAQVYGDALIYGNAQVYGNARVLGNAKVFGNAAVFGNAWVSENAKVCGKAQVCKDEITTPYDIYNITSNQQYNITITPNYIKIGCQCHPQNEWWAFGDKDIIEMDGRRALAWWKKWKPILQAICEVQNETN